MIRAKQGMSFAALTILMLGCQTQVIGGGTGGDGGGKDGTTSSGVISGSTGSVGTGDVDGGPAPLPDDGAAIAMLFSELPASDPDVGTGGVSSSTGGSTVDPNTLFLFVSNGAQSCLDPHAQPAGCAARYQVSISLPPALQAVGTYPLKDIGFVSLTEPGGPGSCAGGGGSYWDGTIDITAIDGANVTFTLAGTAGVFFNPGTTADGTYTAKRCF
jgi:hypothetical protein